MNRKCMFLTALVSTTVILVGATVEAQDLAVAERLFNEGVTKLKEGRYDVACPALRESQRIDPRSGTLFALADCEDKAGRIATAAALYEDYLRSVAEIKQTDKLRHQKRIQMANARKAALVAEIPELTLTLPPSAPKGVKITRDGMELTEAALGVSLPLDPGEHVVVTQAPGGPAVEQTIVLARGEMRTIELKVEAPGAPPSVSSLAVLKSGGLVTKAPPPDPQLDSRSSGRRTGAFIAGGIGLAGLAVGGVAGGLALQKKSIVDERCIDKECDSEGKAAADAGKTLAIVSTVGFGVGVAGAATAVVLWLVSPTDSKAGRASGRLQAGVLEAGMDGAVLGVKGGF